MPQTLRDVPEVDPDTRGQENPKSTSTDKSIVIIICIWTIIPISTHHDIGLVRDVGGDAARAEGALLRVLLEGLKGLGHVLRGEPEELEDLPGLSLGVLDEVLVEDNQVVVLQ